MLLNTGGPGRASLKSSLEFPLLAGFCFVLKLTS